MNISSFEVRIFRSSVLFLIFFVVGFGFLQLSRNKISAEKVKIAPPATKLQRNFIAAVLVLDALFLFYVLYFLQTVENDRPLSVPGHIFLSTYCLMVVTGVITLFGRLTYTRVAALLFPIISLALSWYVRFVDPKFTDAFAFLVIVSTIFPLIQKSFLDRMSRVPKS
jgi:hypothetical protein